MLHRESKENFGIKFLIIRNKYEKRRTIKSWKWVMYVGVTTKQFESHTWWRHQMETFSALLAICAGNSPVTGEFPAQRPVERSFDVSLFCAWINDWVNNREGGDLRRHRAHYDVAVMKNGTESYSINMYKCLCVSLCICVCPRILSGTCR